MPIRASMERPIFFCCGRSVPDDRLFIRHENDVECIFDQRAKMMLPALKLGVCFFRPQPRLFRQVACLADVADEVRIAEAQVEGLVGRGPLLLCDPREVEICRDATEPDCHISRFKGADAYRDDDRYQRQSDGDKDRHKMEGRL